MNDSNTLAKVADKSEAQYVEIQQTIDSAKELALSQVPAIKKAIVMSQAIRMIRGYLSDKMMLDIMELQDTPLGFRTDRADDGGYPLKTVRDCMLEALVRGVMPVGNEFNIIAGRTYITREGFTRLVREYPGLSDLVMKPGLPRVLTEGAVVPYDAEFQLKGEKKNLHRDIPVRTNKGQGVDAILGKATRKMLAYIYSTVTGSDFFPDGEVDEDPSSAPSTTPPRGSAAEAVAGMMAEVAEKAQATDKSQDSLARAREIAAQYTLHIQPDKDVGFVGWTKELPMCMADGRTQEKAEASAREAAAIAIEVALSKGAPYPKPGDFTTHDFMQQASAARGEATRESVQSRTTSPLSPRPGTQVASTK